MQGLGSEWGGQDGRNVMWERSTPGTAESKLLKSLIHFRKQTKHFSSQHSFISSAGGMPFQRGPETGRLWRHQRPPLTCRAPVDGAFLPAHWSWEIQRSSLLCKERSSANGQAQDLKAHSLTALRFTDVMYEFP